MKLPTSLRRLSTLQLALGVSIAVHAVLLTVRFVDPERFERVFQDTPLEVILVNARANETPDKAQAIAQTSLAGGGDADQGRATSPMPYSALTTVGDDFEEKQRQLDAMQEQQNQLLTQLRQQVAALPPIDPRLSADSKALEAQEEKRLQLIKLLAEIEKRINEENARPKKRYISPATKEAVYAVYYDALRRRVEERGTRDFPTHQGRKLYGELTMNITIDAQGRLVDATVVRASGSKPLDQRAISIVQAAAPFGRFGEQMRRQADQIVVISRFRFTRESGLSTTLSGR